jgi:hypothetical protein
MSEESAKKLSTTSEVTIEDVNRVLEVGHLLLSVLSEEEIEALQELLIKDESKNEIGNTSVT